MIGALKEKSPIVGSLQPSEVVWILELLWFGASLEMLMVVAHDAASVKNVSPSSLLPLGNIVTYDCHHPPIILHKNVFHGGHL